MRFNFDEVRVALEETTLRETRGSQTFSIDYFRWNLSSSSVSNYWEMALTLGPGSSIILEVDFIRWFLRMSDFGFDVHRGYEVCYTFFHSGFAKLIELMCRSTCSNGLSSVKWTQIFCGVRFFCKHDLIYNEFLGVFFKDVFNNIYTLL